MFVFPQPLGPTIAVMPGRIWISVRSAKDLNPNSATDESRMTVKLY
jgi:hypothetical protein